MSEKGTLKRKLAELASAGVAGAGVYVDASDTGSVLICGILKEIDTTVLPRQIRFETDLDRTLVCEVTGRRLVRITSMTGRDDLVGQTLDISEEGTLDGLRDLLSGFVEGSSAVRATHTALGRSVEAGEIGVSAGALAEAFGIDLAPSADGDAQALVDRFIADNEDTIPAWYCAAGREKKSAGRDEWVDDLTEIARTVKKSYFEGKSALVPKRDAGGVVILDMPDAPENALFFGRLGNVYLTCRVNRENVEALASGWRLLLLL